MFDGNTSSIVIGSGNNQVAINIQQLKNVSNEKSKEKILIELYRINHNRRDFHRF